MAKGQVLVQWLGAANGACVDIYDSCNYWGLWSELPPRPCYGHTAMVAMPLWVACRVTWDHGDILAQAAAKNRV